MRMPIAEEHPRAIALLIAAVALISAATRVVRGHHHVHR